MARELEILSKLKQKQALDADDKTQIYLGKSFILPGAYTSTTLMHQIVLLKNSVDILSALDLSQLKNAICSGDGSAATHTPLGLLLHEIVYKGLDPSSYKEAICFLIEHGADVEFIKYALSEDYCRQDILSIIDECEVEAAAKLTSTISIAETFYHSVSSNSTLTGEAHPHPEQEHDFIPKAISHF